MIEMAEEVAFRSITINGYNDRADCFYHLVKQFADRFKTSGYTNNIETHNNLTQFTEIQMADYTIFLSGTS